MKKMISLFLLTFSMLATVPAFAADTCTCDKKCQSECSKGKSDTCPCDCGCKEGKGCKHGQCTH